MSPAAPELCITSEVGRLRKVICHSPGPELTVVTPSNRADYLFDDILDLEIARREHSRFVAILSRFAEVLEVSDQLTEILAIPEARSYLMNNSGDAIRERATADAAGLPDLDGQLRGQLIAAQEREHRRTARVLRPRVRERV